MGAEGLVGIAVPDKGVVGITQIQAMNSLVNPTLDKSLHAMMAAVSSTTPDDPIDHIPHLVNDSLK